MTLTPRLLSRSRRGRIIAIGSPQRGRSGEGRGGGTEEGRTRDITIAFDMGASGTQPFF
jgi:hypothetical protein